MDPARIARALSPFIPERALNDAQLQQVSAYLDLLLKWNAKINLTSVRSPDEILTRHFGESFFLAHRIFYCHPERSEGSLPVPIKSRASAADEPIGRPANQQVVDLGSGAGFPGLPIKIYAPDLDVILIESNQKKATFLREVIRVLKLTGINVFSARAEKYLAQLSGAAKVGKKEGIVIPSENASHRSAFEPRDLGFKNESTGQSANESMKQSNEQVSKSASEPIIVTLRAVEHFDRVLPLAAEIVTAHSTEPMSQSTNEPIPRLIALLISSSQLPTAHRLLPHFHWSAPIPVPLSHSRILLFGRPLRPK